MRQRISTLSFRYLNTDFLTMRAFTTYNESTAAENYANSNHSLTDCFKLSNGVEIPCIGYGTWQTPNGGVTESCVKTAIQNGYKHIDTAWIYGNEAEVGAGIKASGVKREDIFLTSKHWVTERGYDKTIAAVDSCVFENIGAQAVYIRGENVEVDSPRVTKNIQVNNNIVSGYGKVFFNAVGILVIHANSVDITHNEIHDGYYTAISVGWVWGYDYTVTYNNRICDNLIYNIGQGWLSDMGGIYTLGNQPGTVISGNVIHNVAADPNEGGYGGWGIYLDEGSAYILVENNLAYCCGSDSYHLHYGSYNTVRNNIFALSGESQVRVASSPKRSVAKDGGKKTADFTNNILLTDKNVRTFSYLQNDECYYEKNNIFWDISNDDEIFVSKDEDFKKGLSIETAERKGMINSPVVADPLFRDAANYDFELSDDSPAIKAGFKKWDYSQAGTLKNTTVGLDTAGGETPYNAEAKAVDMKASREQFHIFRVIWNRICKFFNRIFKRR